MTSAPTGIAEFAVAAICVSSSVFRIPHASDLGGIARPTGVPAESASAAASVALGAECGCWYRRECVSPFGVAKMGLRGAPKMGSTWPSPFAFPVGLRAQLTHVMRADPSHGFTGVVDTVITLLVPTS